jgi:hypothetical protein
MPSGAHRELVDALHDLHHRAGWPSLRHLAAAAGCSHTTVSKAFSSPALPTWGTLELLVEAMDGDTAAFHALWLRASTPADARPAPPVAGIAGRRTELTAVRRHFQTGTGLMLVTGEAGIGKTRLVTAAAQSADTFVALGHCLPLSTQVPLMPIVDVLRAIHDVDDGQRLKEALAVAPPYVHESLARLLPELAARLAPASPDEFSRQRLFAATARCLSRLHSLGGLGLLVEDLHWADTATLDLVEHLVAAGLEVPIVGTWRLDDPDTGDQQREWWLRVRRLPTVATLDLAPLTREETTVQCRLLGLDLDEESVEQIHRRSGGQPLFTEQLAAQAGADTDLPVILADLLDRRLDQLDQTAQDITRALGVADRGLAPPVLAAVTGHDEGALTQGLRDLTSRRLLAPTSRSGDVQLRHPLLAEAVRRRLVAGEAATVHQRLAVALGNQPGTGAAEVAQHWQGAGDPERELDWRIAAARAAGARWATSQEAEQWLRALQVWPSSPARVGDPPLSRPEAYLAAVDALKDSLQFDRAAAMSDDAAVEFPVLEPGLRAEFLRRAAVFRAEREGPEVGLELIDEAIGILSDLPPGTGMVQAMARKHQLLLKRGRYVEAFGVARETAVAAEAAGDRRAQRLMLGRVAWHEAIAGGLEQGSLTMAHARSLSSSVADPTGAIWLAVIWTDVLLICGARSTKVEEAGQDALALAEEQGIEDFGPVLVRYNMASALIRDGRLMEAAALLGPGAEHDVDLDRAPIYLARALLDALGGHPDEAAHTVEVLWDSAAPVLDLEFVSTIATIHLWGDQPQEAWSRLQHVLTSQVDSTPTPLTLPALVLAARAAADLAAPGTAEAVRFRDSLLDLHRRAHTGRPVQGWATARALAGTWSAELARLEGTDSTRRWLVADSEWGRVGRPHDAAYCRWRAAQVALREGRGTVAARLLARARTHARGHVALLAAIDDARPI